ncbi:hypothetical protein AVEN_7042-1 [Araneus ventricosus]|uniref:Uncharacterized protein n=1 Tax=Araneus ventricosus TaxID=182803 RepID=A0A4Y2PYR6_ARAVE|nr:hypothetical protein AVEN_7042-1 [Araneus ventricosus]
MFKLINLLSKSNSSLIFSSKMRHPSVAVNVLNFRLGKNELSMPKTFANVRNRSELERNLDIQPVPITIDPFGLRAIEESRIGVIGSGWICVEWSGRE